MAQGEQEPKFERNPSNRLSYIVDATDGRRTDGRTDGRRTNFNFMLLLIRAKKSPHTHTHTNFKFRNSLNNFVRDPPWDYALNIGSICCIHSGVSSQIFSSKWSHVNEKNRKKVKKKNRIMKHTHKWSLGMVDRYCSS